MYLIGHFFRTDWLYSALSFGYDRGFPGSINAQWFQTCIHTSYAHDNPQLRGSCTVLMDLTCEGYLDRRVARTVVKTYTPGYFDHVQT